MSIKEKRIKKYVKFYIRIVNLRREGHLVDALAIRGDEGRNTLRKAAGSCE